MAPPMRRFLTAYHLTHLTVLLAYPLLISRVLKRAFPTNADSLWTWEKQIAATTVAVLSMKFLKRDNLDGWIIAAIRYTEASILALLYVADQEFRLLLVGILLSFIGYAYLVPPRYSGPTKADQITPATLHDLILKSEWEKEDSKINWVILVHADWSTNSTSIAPTYHDISVKYATDKVKFVTLDVGRFPETAEKTLGVPLDSTGPACAIPSILLFRKGKETTRLPRAYLEGAKIKGSRLRGVDIVTGLRLDDLFEKSKGKSLEAKKRE